MIVPGHPNRDPELIVKRFLDDNKITRILSVWDDDVLWAVMRIMRSKIKLTEERLTEGIQWAAGQRHDATQWDQRETENVDGKTILEQLVKRITQ